jgi:hypothetical protein
MKLILTTVICIGISSSCWAGSTICKVEESSIGIKAIGWNDENMTAKVTDSLGDSFNGVITLKRQHSSDGEKVNLLFEFGKPRLGLDAKEYIVFPIGKNEFRVIGVAYIVRGGQRYLEMSEGNYKATCISM